MAHYVKLYLIKTTQFRHRDKTIYTQRENILWKIKSIKIIKLV